MTDSYQKDLRKALAHHQAGRVDEAEALYRRVLDALPDQPDALLMLALIWSDSPDPAAAEALLDRHRTVKPGDPAAAHLLGRLRQSAGDDRAAVDLLGCAVRGSPDLVPLRNDLAVSLYRLGDHTAALDHLDTAIALDSAYGPAHANRGMVLFAVKRFLEAAQAYLAALDHAAPADRPPILRSLAVSAAKVGELALAERACRALLSEVPGDAEAAAQLDRIAEMNRDLYDDQSSDLRNTFARNRGLVREGPNGGAEATILVMGAVGAEHLPTRYLFDPALFTILTFSLVSPDQPDAPLGAVGWEQIKDVDLVFNPLGEIEKSGGQFEAALALHRALAKPVFNPIASILPTGRNRAVERFGTTPGLVVPAVAWASRDDLAQLDLTAPKLVRPAGAHGGNDLSLLATSADAAAYLGAHADARFLVTDFHDFKSADGLYRKYRMIFVDREPFAYHLAIGEHWLLHYWRAEMALSEAKRREEERFLTDWRAVFGPLGTQAVEAVAAKLDLDYGGLDCAIRTDGQVLFFEANACMLVHLDDGIEPEFAYKRHAVPRIRDAVSAMVRKKIMGRPDSSGHPKP